MMQGAFFLACSNMSRTRLAPTPTNISTKSEPEMVKNGTLASPATARAISVLPVPGGPTSNTPRGMRPPRRWNFPGSRRNSTISCKSDLASSTPATSSKVTRPCASASNFARDLPKPSALPPAPCICRDRKIHTPIKAINGNYDTSSEKNHGPHAALVDLAQELRERDVLRGRALAWILEQREQRQQQQDDNHPEGEIAQIGVHQASLPAASGAVAIVMAKIRGDITSIPFPNVGSVPPHGKGSNLT